MDYEKNETYKRSELPNVIEYITKGVPDGNIYKAKTGGNIYLFLTKDSLNYICLQSINLN